MAGTPSCGRIPAGTLRAGNGPHAPEAGSVLPDSVAITSTCWKGTPLARTNYNYEKRRKELAKKKKKEDKKLRKLEKRNPQPDEAQAGDAPQPSVGGDGAAAPVDPPTPTPEQ